MAAGELNLDNPVMKDFVFYVAVVVLKMIAMAALTARARLANKIYVSKEDLQLGEGAKIDFSFEPVECIRRNHQNDMENVVPFVLLGFCYVLLQPAPSTALLVFRIFTASRIIHTMAYQFHLPQPTRFLAFLVGFLVNIYLGIHCIMRCM